MSLIDGKVVLVTGGTGSFGRRFVATALKDHAPKKLIIFSRDELKQSEMQASLAETDLNRVRFFIGDVRDRDRLYRAFDGVDIVIHAAALKQVPAADKDNPIEAVRTNVLGAANVIDAAIDRHVSRVIALSTDKAANPINLYGATKLCADKLVIAGNSYSGHHQTRLSVVRYGNVVGSRGSVIPLFQRLRKTGVLPITDPNMTRFWITLEQGVAFVLASLGRMEGGEVFVPKIPSMKVLDLARALAPECETRIVGIRPGEKLHEVMVPEDEARSTLEYEAYFAILPPLDGLRGRLESRGLAGTPCPAGFRYGSDTNTKWLSIDDLRQMIDAFPDAH